MNAETAATPGGVRASPTGSWGRIDRLIESLGERLNPILVKEARQALKSRQFVLTFGLLLTAGWVWSWLGLALMGPEVHQGTSGPTMFSGYFVILAFPLLVVVPFGAYRSLAAEQEDRTYELLSITDLSPRQIAGGKLASAVVQMLIYLSAIAPCLAFTYMLRGIALPMILTMIFYLALASLGFSAVGLLAGTLTGEKRWQVVLSVVLIAALLLAFWIACYIAVKMIYEAAEVHFDDPNFWLRNGAFLTAYAGYFALVFFAAVAQITFASDNRSTRLRVVMAIQQLCLVGWTAWFVLSIWPREEGFFFFYFSLIALHWYAMGALMTGEWPEMSSRVKRRLPQSLLGRAFLTWFNPGPGTGFMFATGGMLAALAAGGAMIFLSYACTPGSNWPGSTLSSVLVFAVLATCYVVIYLGAGLLVIRMGRKVVNATLFLAALAQILLVALGVAGPLLVQSLSRSIPFYEYTWLQIPNPFWTLMHVVARSALPAETPILIVVLPLAALVVFVLNLPGVAREVRQVRIVAPQRVVEEDTQQAAQAHPPRPRQISPWDRELPEA